MPFDIETRVRRELACDEKLLWSGAPIRGVRLQIADAFLIPFSLMWGGFAFAWEAGVLYSTGVRVSATPPYVTGTVISFMAIWGIPFCLIGLYMVFGRFFFDAAARARTAYAVTSRRIIVARGNSVRSLALNALPEMELKEGRDSRGSIIFGPSSFFMGAGWPAWGYRGRAQPMMFEGIARVRDIYALIIETAQKGGR